MFSPDFAKNQSSIWSFDQDSNNNNNSNSNNNNNNNWMHRVTDMPMALAAAAAVAAAVRTVPDFPSANSFQHGPEECVKVKSCAHVSFIVGKQGKKIREIRRQTNTYIETPVNGEEPVFRIRGTHPNIAEAKRMILASASEFDNELFMETQVPCEDGKERYNLYLPARFIGLVVGRQGYCIKKIMQACNVEIVTPKINTLNLFKLTGHRGNVFAAVQDIRKHIQEATSHDVELKMINHRELQLSVLIRYE